MNHGFLKSSTDSTLMCLASNLPTHALIWLTAILSSVQGLPVSASSGCGPGRSGCLCEQANKKQPPAAVTSQNCCRPKKRTRCCASKIIQRKSCCSTTKTNPKSTCSCNVSCACKQGQKQAPALPPSRNQQTKQIISQSASTLSVSIPIAPTCSSQDGIVSSLDDALASLDRCAFLCRFTL